MLLAFRLVAFSPIIAFWKLSVVLATGLEHQWAVVLTDVHAFASSVPILLWLLALFDVDEVRVVGGDEGSCGVGDRNCGRSVDWRGRDKHCEAAEDIDPAKDGFEDRHDGGFLAVGEEDCRSEKEDPDCDPVSLFKAFYVPISQVCGKVSL
jgi:hypothetical protein